VSARQSGLAVCKDRPAAGGATALISSMARWVLFLGSLLALYYYFVVFDPDLLRWLLARLHY
jgi:hypothetical protein